MCSYQGRNSYLGAGGFTLLWPFVFQIKDTAPIKGQKDLFSFGLMPSNSKAPYLSRGKRIYFPLTIYLQIQVSRIKGDDPLDMVSLILKEGRSKTKFKFLQTKTRPNHSMIIS